MNKPTLTITAGKWYVCHNNKTAHGVIAYTEGKAYCCTEDYFLPNDSGKSCDWGDPDEAAHFFRPWSIDDAKQGDVIFTTGGASSEKKVIIFIFKGIGERTYLSEPCVEHYCYYCEDELYMPSATEYMGILSEHKSDKSATRPATKEERDLLFLMMKSAGYGFDFLLNKLLQVPKLSDKNDPSEFTELENKVNAIIWCAIQNHDIIDVDAFTKQWSKELRDIMAKEQAPSKPKKIGRKVEGDTLTIYGLTPYKKETIERIIDTWNGDDE